MQNDKKFLSRPARKFLRDDDAISNGGVVTFAVKYIGCIEVYASMKVLDFSTRSLVARECINKVHDAAIAKTPSKRRESKSDKKLQQYINSQPCLEHAGTKVSLNISSRCLEIVSLDTAEVIARHDMPRISFASGGDAVSWTNILRDFLEII